MDDADLRPTLFHRVVAVLCFVGLTTILIYIAGRAIRDYRESYLSALYADCIDRGGTVTEGGMSGRLCVGVKTRGIW